MQLIAVTGGIGSGKSTIAKQLAELGAYRIDADQLARDAVQPGASALRLIEEHFGEDVLKPDGTLDREALAGRVFTNPDQLEVLNAIVHPAVRTLTQERIIEIAESDPDAVIVYDVPLLVESDRTIEWDLVVVAEAPADVRVERLVAMRGMDAADARARIDNQASDADRRKIADVVIDTSGTLDETSEQVVDLWGHIQTFLTDVRD